MIDYKSVLDGEIRAGLKSLDTDADVIRKIFFFDSSKILSKYEEEGFSILNSVAEYFQIPFGSLYIAGSTQTGYTYFKNREFQLGESDLDLALVDSRLFQKYCEISYQVTKQYQDLTKFNNNDQVASFRIYLSKGFFRPDLMPNCDEKQNWFKFFNQLSIPFVHIFKNINCGIYLSEMFFESKQLPLLKKYRRGEK